VSFAGNFISAAKLKDLPEVARYFDKVFLDGTIYCVFFDWQADFRCYIFHFTRRTKLLHALLG